MTHENDYAVEKKKIVQTGSTESSETRRCSQRKKGNFHSALVAVEGGQRSGTTEKAQDSCGGGVNLRFKRGKVLVSSRGNALEVREKENKKKSRKGGTPCSEVSTAPGNVILTKGGGRPAVHSQKKRKKLRAREKDEFVEEEISPYGRNQPSLLLPEEISEKGPFASVPGETSTVNETLPPSDRTERGGGNECHGA